jgi:hypothetical protein
LSLSGDTPHSDHLVTLRPDRSDQDEKRSLNAAQNPVLLNISSKRQEGDGGHVDQPSRTVIINGPVIHGNANGAQLAWGNQTVHQKRIEQIAPGYEAVAQAVVNWKYIMMNEAFSVLASAASSILIATMTGDAWSRAKVKFSHFLSSTGRDSLFITHRLDEDRAALLKLSGDRLLQAGRERQEAWRALIFQSLEEYPESANELQALLQEFGGPPEYNADVVVVGPGVIIGDWGDPVLVTPTLDREEMSQEEVDRRAKDLLSSLSEKSDQGPRIGEISLFGGSPNSDKGIFTPTISVVLYVDTDNEEAIRKVIASVDALVEALGYDGPINPKSERGSFFRQSWAKIRRVFTSNEAKVLAIKTQRALELRYLDSAQAETDNKVADALSKIVASLADVPSACVRAGSILLIKYPGPQGPVILTRNLSQLEISTLERYPEIQKNPQTVLESLSLAIANASDYEPPSQHLRE